MFLFDNSNHMFFLKAHVLSDKLKHIFLSDKSNILLKNKAHFPSANQRAYISDKSKHLLQRSNDK